MNPSEFLLRVRPLPDGGFEATCQAVDSWRSDSLNIRWRIISPGTLDPVEGQGATPLAAMIAALANSQVQDITQTQEGQDA